ASARTSSSPCPLTIGASRPRPRRLGAHSDTGNHLVDLVDLAIAVFGRPAQVWARLASRGSSFANGETLTDDPLLDPRRRADGGSGHARGGGSGALSDHPGGDGKQLAAFVAITPLGRQRPHREGRAALVGRSGASPNAPLGPTRRIGQRACRRRALAARPME